MSSDDNNLDPNEFGEEQQFEPLDLPGEEPLGDLGGDADDPLGLEEPAPVAETPASEEADDAFAESTEDSALEVDESPEPEEERPAKPKAGIGLAGFAVFGVCGLSILALAALDAMVFLSWGFMLMLLMNIFWLVATAIPFIMWMGRRKLNFFEVALGLALACIIFAVALLLLELVEYQGEIGPKGAASAVQLGADRTTAVA